MRWPLMKNTLSFKDKLKLSLFILRNSRLTQGSKVKEFEKAWSDWLGCRYSVFVTSGSTANLLLLDSVIEYHNIPKGAKVLVPASTWTTTVSPVVQLGLTPIFCDVDTKNFGMCVKDMEKIAEEHPDISVIFVAHLLGLSSPVEEYRRIFPNAVVLEDICESHGVRSPEGYKRGSYGISEGSTFSFYFGHHMTTIEGGMISTNNRQFYDLLRMKRSHGLARESLYAKQHAEENPDVDPAFLFMTLGYNFRNTEINAVIGLQQLQKLDSFVEKRKVNYRKFLDIISSREDLFLIPDAQEEQNSSFCLPFLCKNEQILKVLKDKFIEHEIEYRPIIAGNLARHPAYKSIFRDEKSNAEFLHTNGVYIGNNQFLSNKDFTVLSNIIKSL